MLYGQLKLGYRDVGRPCKRNKDYLKGNLRACEIDTVTWEAHTQDRSLWKLSCTKGLEVFKHQRAEAIHATISDRILIQTNQQLVLTGFKIHVILVHFLVTFYLQQNSQKVVAS